MCGNTAPSRAAPFDGLGAGSGEYQPPRNTGIDATNVSRLRLAWSYGLASEQPRSFVERGTLYFGAGQNYSHPHTATSDAIFAVDARNGDIRWIRQFTANDAYNIACIVTSLHPNCPDPVGPDLDFGSPPVLTTTRDGGSLLIAGQKSDHVHALDPEVGALV